MWQSKFTKLVMEFYSRSDFSSMESIRMRETDTNDTFPTQSAKPFQFESPLAKRLIKFIWSFGGGVFSPNRCSASEPVRTPFTLDDIPRVSTWPAQIGGSLLLRRSASPQLLVRIENCRFPSIWKQVGGTFELVKRRPDPIILSRVSVGFESATGEKLSPNVLIEFLQGLSTVLNADYSFLGTGVEFLSKNLLVFRNEVGEVSRMVGTNLEEGIPGLYWVNIFGRDYTAWFGREKFSELSCIHKEWMDDGSILIQTREAPDFAVERDHEAAYQIATHLGRDAFFDIRLSDRACIIPPFLQLESASGK